ncbi:peptidoglycan-binding domain-containing protein, partial [Magnetovibrio sp.]|uniref:peptidoglycan-binding domain-containing protein n=1 Tax=Magnetovibrio sp. TaxID=2024836 RepID=UPI002F91D6AB
NAPEDEDAQDWNSGLLGEETSAPKATPAVDPDAVKNDKPAPAPKTKDDGQNKKGFNFFGNLAEDVRSIFNGTAQGPHSQYDKRNAEAPAEKYGLKGKDRTKPFLRGGYYGPGRGGYSPTGNYDAHFGNPVDGSGFTTRKSAENFPGLLSPGQQDYVAPNALDDLNATFMADAQKTQKEHRQRMADVAKAHQRTARAAERMKELAQTKSAPQSAPRSGYFSKNGVTFTDNWANDLIGGRASATTTPKDGLLGRTADQKASDVGEQSMVSKASASLKGTTPVSERQNTGMELMGSVGQYGLNDPEDVAVLQGALVASGHMNVLNATGWINTPTVVGIKALQKDLGLPTTGTVDPSDRSEEAMAAADQTTYVDAASAPYGRMAQAIRQKYQNELHTHKVSVSANPRNLIDETYHDLTSWHFEDRARLNSPLPSTEDEAIKMGFEKYPDEQSVFHQNNVGQPEKKYGHPDGREVVFDGDTGKVVTDSRYAGTYNYEVPAQMPENIEDFERWLEYLNKGSGHLIKDVAPYAIGGNVRGRN